MYWFVQRKRNNPLVTSSAPSGSVVCPVPMGDSRPVGMRCGDVHFQQEACKSCPKYGDFCSHSPWSSQPLADRHAWGGNQPGLHQGDSGSLESHGVWTTTKNLSDTRAVLAGREYHGAPRVSSYLWWCLEMACGSVANMEMFDTLELWNSADDIRQHQHLLYWVIQFIWGEDQGIFASGLR